MGLKLGLKIDAQSLKIKRITITQNKETVTWETHLLDGYLCKFIEFLSFILICKHDIVHVKYVSQGTDLVSSLYNSSPNWVHHHNLVILQVELISILGVQIRTFLLHEPCLLCIWPASCPLYLIHSRWQDRNWKSWLVMLDVYTQYVRWLAKCNKYIGE